MSDADVMLKVLYLLVSVLSVLDIVLIRPALRRAKDGQTIARLTSTLLVLLGLALAAYGRVAHNIDVVIIGVTFVDVGLIGYTVSLPGEGLIDRIRRRRDRRRRER